jgi:NUC153 domain
MLDAQQAAAKEGAASADDKAGSKKRKAPAGNLLEDDRFKALFEDPSFAVDEAADEYRALHPNAGRQLEAALVLSLHFVAGRQEVSQTPYILPRESQMLLAMRSQNTMQSVATPPLSQASATMHNLAVTAAQASEHDLSQKTHRSCDVQYIHQHLP